MRTCARCSGDVGERFRFCPWCGGALRLKVVDFFHPHPLLERDRGKALRVSRHLGEAAGERHVRFSVWHESGASVAAEAAVSLDEAEAARLARFLGEPAPLPEEGETTSRLR